jgi:uncharacterized membrane protein YhaH (DUF805 family)
MEWMLMPLRRYADFAGRSQRQEYWLFVLFSILLYIAAIIVLIALIATLEPGTGKGEAPSVAVIVGILLIGLLYLGLFIPTLAVQVRRFHDQDLSGWFVLLAFVPYLGGLIMLVFMCIDGTAGPNRFGPDPKGRGGGQHSDIFA